jgi:hypothetical protein
MEEFLEFVQEFFGYRFTFNHISLVVLAVFAGAVVLGDGECVAYEYRKEAEQQQSSVAGNIFALAACAIYHAARNKGQRNGR